MRALILLSILLLAAGCTSGGEPGIKVHNASVKPSPMVANAVSIFMKIENTGDGEDALLSASIKEHPQARVELHDVVEGRMQKVEEIRVPPQKSVELKSGSLHIMAFNVKSLEKDMTVVLNFRESGRVEVKATRE